MAYVEGMWRFEMLAYQRFEIAVPLSHHPVEPELFREIFIQFAAFAGVPGAPSRRALHALAPVLA